MAGGLVGLLDDVASLAKMAAASVDDVGGAAARASAKAAGVVIDDTAVTPAFVRSLASHREIPIILRIGRGSLRNKFLVIIPIALALSAIAPLLVEVLLLLGSVYLAYEGTHKFLGKEAHDEGDDHRSPVSGGTTVHSRTSATGESSGTSGSPSLSPSSLAEETRLVKGAVRTDLVLSAEIMVIVLKEVLERPLVLRAAVLAVVGFAITLGIYGAVALIVKMDDLGLVLAESEVNLGQKVGQALVRGMPLALAWLSRVGVAAMLWVAGHIAITGSHELGFRLPYEAVHALAEWVRSSVPGFGGLAAWIADTGVSAVVGLVVGGTAILATSLVARARKARGSI